MKNVKQLFKYWSIYVILFGIINFIASTINEKDSRPYSMIIKNVALFKTKDPRSSGTGQLVFYYGIVLFPIEYFSRKKHKDQSIIVDPDNALFYIFHGNMFSLTTIIFILLVTKLDYNTITMSEIADILLLRMDNASGFAYDSIIIAYGSFIVGNCLGIYRIIKNSRWQIK